MTQTVAGAQRELAGEGVRRLKVVSIGIARLSARRNCIEEESRGAQAPARIAVSHQLGPPPRHLAAIVQTRALSPIAYRQRLVHRIALQALRDDVGPELHLH